jgi:hypothetical protein
MTSRNESGDFFQEAFEVRGSKTASIAFSMASTVTGLIVNYALIWFQKHNSKHPTLQVPALPAKAKAEKS